MPIRQKIHNYLRIRFRCCNFFNDQNLILLLIYIFFNKYLKLDLDHFYAVIFIFFYST
jgi:hypothetical protein